MFSELVLHSPAMCIWRLRGIALFRDQPILAGIEMRALNAKKNRITDCLWDLLLAEIKQLGAPTRESLGLNPDFELLLESFLHDEIEVIGQHRLAPFRADGDEARLRIFR